MCAVAQFERRLVELGCPGRQLRRCVREMADHYEDLMEAALAEGLPQAEAEARASRDLGEQRVLAEEAALVLRQGSCWGRHRIIAYCLLPPLGVFVMSALGVGIGLGLARVCFSAEEWRVLAGGGAGFGLAVAAVQGACCVTIAFITLLFCWLARRSVCGLRWALAACAACFLQSYFCSGRILPHRAVLGYSSSSNWICWTVPLVVAAGVAVRQRRNVARLAAEN